MLFRVASLALSILAASAGFAAAQVEAPPAVSKTSGLELGVYLNGSALAIENEDEVESGGGLGARLGYGFTDRFQIFAAVTAANVEYSDVDDTYALGHFDLGGRFSFGSTAAKLRPFVQAAVGGRAVSLDLGGETLDLRGAGFTGGAGLAYFLAPSVALDLGLDFTLGQFTEGRADGGDWEDLEDFEFDAQTTRFNIGLAWHP
ncbi:MAG: outer membrane beta-barrel protein [Longimicrobiaceae bacterium]